MASVTPLSGWLGWCRAGFEPELAAEFAGRAASRGITGYPRAGRDDGYVLFVEAGAEIDSAASDALPVALAQPAPIFARRALRLVAELRGLDPGDRITPIIDALTGRAPYADLIVEHPDADSGRPLSGLARAFGNALRAALRKQRLLEAGSARSRGSELARDASARSRASSLPQRLHVALLAGDHLLLAEGDADAPAWPGGIPRLKTHPEAPSRSALKLDEALQVLLAPDERERWLQPGMRAADLGAAPGGWSWVLARQHLRVVAIDNGPMAASALATGVIEHLRADGFRWQPREPLDWLVCDMVEQPVRVAARMAEWFAHGWCRRAIFNLKLPMKKRWDETRRCLELFAEQAGRPLEIRARQLYHDREEITVYAGPAGR